jgi:Flp pilus assembly protein TadD
LRRAVEIGDRTEPDNLVPRLRLAEALMAVGMHDEAETCLRRAHEIDSYDPNVVYGLGVLAAQRGELKESRLLLLRCQHAESTRQKASQQLAAVCQRIGKSDEAARFAQKARELPKDVNWADPYTMDYRQRAEGKQIRFQHAERLAAQGKYQDAVQKLQEILADGPDYRAYVGIGVNLGKIGDIDGAERALREAVKIQPENAKAYYYLSRIHLARGQNYRVNVKDEALTTTQFRAAEETARQALLRKPDDAFAHTALGLALQHQGKRMEALQALRNAVECGPDQIDPHLHLGELLIEAGLKKEAVMHLEFVIRQASHADPLRKTAEELLLKATAEE